MSAVCFRIDLEYSPREWEVVEESDPSYVVRILEAVRAFQTHLHFFATADCVLTFPNLADVIIGEGHALDPLVLTSALERVSERSLGREQIRVEAAFSQKEVVSEGIGMDIDDLQSHLQLLLRHRYRWIGLSCAQRPQSHLAMSKDVTIYRSNGLCDKRYFTSCEAAKSVPPYLDMLDKAFNTNDDFLLFHFHAMTLAKADPACAIIRYALNKAQDSGRRVITLREKSHLQTANAE